MYNSKFLIKMSNNTELRVSLEEEFIKKIEKLKSYYGIKNTTELIRLLITEKFRDITNRD